MDPTPRNEYNLSKNPFIPQYTPQGFNKIHGGISLDGESLEIPYTLLFPSARVAIPDVIHVRVTSRRYPRQTECKCQKRREHPKGTRRTSTEGPIEARESIRDREEERIAGNAPTNERESMIVDGFIRIIFVLRFSNEYIYIYIFSNFCIGIYVNSW